MQGLEKLIKESTKEEFMAAVEDMTSREIEKLLLELDISIIMLQSKTKSLRNDIEVAKIDGDLGKQRKALKHLTTSEHALAWAKVKRRIASSIASQKQPERSASDAVLNYILASATGV